MRRRKQKREEGRRGKGGERGREGERRVLVLLENLTKDPQHHLWVDIISLT